MFGVILAAVLALCLPGCASLNVPTATPPATATIAPTSTRTPSPTVAPTVPPTATTEPLRVQVNLYPPQVSQGHTLCIEVAANRRITVGGTLDGQPLKFVEEQQRAWTAVGMSAAQEAGVYLLELAVSDQMGAGLMTTVPVLVTAGAFGSEEIIVPDDRVPLLDREVQERDSRRLVEAFAAVTPEKRWQGAFIWPHEGIITSPYGMRRTYNDGRTSYHAGIDISGDIGAPVVAAGRGQVVLAAALEVHGNAVVLDHGLGVYTAYYHLSEIEVAEGQEVVQGALIGEVGNTGLSTGAHLHWELRVGGVAVDAEEWTVRGIPEGDLPQ